MGRWEIYKVEYRATPDYAGGTQIEIYREGQLEHEESFDAALHNQRGEHLIQDWIEMEYGQDEAEGVGASFGDHLSREEREAIRAVDAAIHRSKITHEIVTLPWSKAHANELRAQGAQTDAQGSIYWNADEGWHVHLTRRGR
jgi:hypothetical protein